jgi:hypothetical protein
MNKTFNLLYFHHCPKKPINTQCVKFLWIEHFVKMKRKVWKYPDYKNLTFEFFIGYMVTEHKNTFFILLYKSPKYANKSMLNCHLIFYHEKFYYSWIWKDFLRGFGMEGVIFMFLTREWVGCYQWLATQKYRMTI